MTTAAKSQQGETMGPDEPVMFPASFAQELFWLIQRASPGSDAYNVPRSQRLLGALDVAALRRSFDALVARHEILRTTYATRGDQTVQVIHPPRAVPFEIIDLSAVPREAREEEAVRIVQDRAARPFDLASELLLRATLLRLDEREHVLLFESHHIAFDGWSRDVVFRELDAFYTAYSTGREPSLPPLPIQYADFAIWQREELTGPRLEALLAWWRDELGDAEHVLRLPTDFPRPAVSRYEGTWRSRLLSAAQRDDVRRLGQRYGATPYMVVLAAYASVLHRYTGQPDILVGSPIADRARPELEGLIGFFANTIVQRARFAGDPSFGAVLSRLRESALGAYDRQEVPFEKLVLELEGGTSVGQSPLFQVVLTQLDGSNAPESRIGEVVLAPFGLDAGTTKFDLTLFMLDRPEGLDLTLRGRTDLHHVETIDRLLGHIVAVLDAAAADPEARVSTLPLLGADERAAHAQWNATETDLGAPATVAQLVAAQASRVPDRIAVVARDRALSYAELDAQANRIARRLAAMGVGAEAPVGIMLDRSTDLIAAILGVLTAGAAYVPVLPELPEARAAQQLGECGATVVITTAIHRARVPSHVVALLLDEDAAALAAEPSTPPDVPQRPDALAYVLFTSGSTGVPKGVAVTNANVVHYARGMSRVLGDVSPARAGDGFAHLDGWHFGMVSTLGADLGNTSLYSALFSGGTLHLIGPEDATDPTRWAAYVTAHPIDVLKITPNHLRALVGGLDGPELAGALPRGWTVLGGEPLTWDFADRLLRAQSCRVLNHYGPTETTVGVATFEVTATSAQAARTFGAQTVPIGRPMANVQLHVVDAHRQPMPVGIPGELFVAGGGVARGYLRRPELTAERFVELGGERAYRTGDRVRRHVDGTLEFLGRTDDQVKVRGYRVELGELESVLRSHPGVAQAVVVLRGDEGTEEPALVAYVVARPGGYAASHTDRVTPTTLATWAGAALPEYMVPSSVMLLDELPLTANGKVDRAKLPGPDADESGARGAPIAPRTPTEEAIAGIWREVLKRESVSVTDNFLTLGGHSLLAIRVLGKLSRTFGIRLPLRALFDAPTVEQLSELVDLELQLAAVAALDDGGTPA